MKPCCWPRPAPATAGGAPARHAGRSRGCRPRLRTPRRPRGCPVPAAPPCSGMWYRISMPCRSAASGPPGPSWSGAATCRNSASARTATTRCSGSRATPGTRRSRPAGRPAGRRWRWRSAWCRWPMARMYSARCAIRRRGTTCSASGPRPAGCRWYRTWTPSGASSTPKARWAARWRSCASCWRYRPGPTRARRWRCRPTPAWPGRR